MIPDDTREIYKKFKEKQKEEELKNHDDSLYREHG
jgi:ubiquitin carboxyl-terminal hydrolase 14